MSKDSSSISFTAYYTGEVWRQQGLSSPIFTNPTGQVLYQLGRPAEAMARLLAGTSIGITLLQRHQIIDAVVKQAIEQHGVSQIVEIACGFSPRGVRLREHYPHLHYIEADLPEMAARKRHLLKHHGLLSRVHQVVDLDILQPDGPLSVSQVFAKQLDPQRRTLVITEGLVNYFELAVITGFWQRLALALGPFAKAAYVTDLYPNLRWHPMVKLSRAFKHSLALATRSTVSLHFDDHDAIEMGFIDCGFESIKVHIPEAYYDVLPIPSSRVASLVRVVECWIQPE